MVHYPAWVKSLRGGRFDLILAGIRMADKCEFLFTARSWCRTSVDEYDLGLFQTERGPLYVNPASAGFPCRSGLIAGRRLP